MTEPEKAPRELVITGVLPLTGDEAPVLKLNGSLFSHQMEVLEFVSEKESGSGMWSIPEPMLKVFDAAYRDLVRHQSAILDYLRSTGQHVPWGLQTPDEQDLSARKEFDLIDHLPAPEQVATG